MRQQLKRKLIRSYANVVGFLGECNDGALREFLFLQKKEAFDEPNSFILSLAVEVSSWMKTLID